jgi:hypothetical protein
MTERHDPHDISTSDIPNRASNQEKTEGSRENVNVNEEGGGISNRPIAEEQAEQQSLPPRGSSKGGAHA